MSAVVENYVGLSSNLAVTIISNTKDRCSGVLDYLRSLQVQSDACLLSELKEFVQFNKNSIYICHKEDFSIFEINQINKILKQSCTELYFYSFDISSDKSLSTNTLYLPMNKLQLLSSIELLKELTEKTYQARELERFVQSRSRLISLGELTSSILHDLNNFMMVSSASYSGIKFAMEKNQCQKKISRFCKLGSRATDELMNISARCDSFMNGQDAIVIETFYLNDIVLWLEEIFKRELSKYNINFKYDVGKSVIIKSDRSIIMQSLLNLVKNSIKAIKGSKSDKWIEVIFDLNQNVPTIKVIDSGSINEEVSKLVFGINFSSCKKNGHGIGLYLVRKRLKELGITINVSLSSSSNTTFELILPSGVVTSAR